MKHVSVRPGTTRTSWLVLAATAITIGLACSDSTVSAGPLKLYGTFRLVDNTDPRSTTNMTFTVADANLHEAGCPNSASPCPETIVSYFGSATVQGDSLKFEAPLFGSVEVLLEGNVVGNEIRGGLAWYTYLGCCAHQYYNGTFVANRQP